MDMNQIVSDLSALIVPAAKSLLMALIVFFVGFKIVNAITKPIRKGKCLKNLDESTAGFVASFISIALKVAVIVTVVAILGVPMTSMVALIASAGVAIGLAVQGALSNLVGGLMILLFRPFRAGDYIEAEGASGTVKQITVFYTILATPDNKIVTVPNGTITNSVITNYSLEEARRVDLEFLTDYQSDSETVKTILLKVASDCELAQNDPAPIAMMNECGENGVKYVLRVWCKTADYWTLREQLLLGVRNAFAEESVSIPFKLYNVRLKNDEE